MMKASTRFEARVSSFISCLTLWVAILIFIHGIAFAESLNSDNLSFIKAAPPLEVAVKGNGERFDIAIKNVSPVSLVLSKRSLLKMDVLWFIKINGQRMTSGVRGEVISAEMELQKGVTFAAETSLSDIKHSKEFILIDSGETMSFPIPKESFIASGIIGVADSISEENRLDVTVALADPVAGFIGDGDRLRAFRGQLTIFSSPVKLSRIPSLK
jgi:hypothetical protein